MENFTTANFFKGFKLAKISMYFSKNSFDDLGSVSLERLTGRETIFNITYFKERIKKKKLFNLDFLIGEFGLTEHGSFFLYSFLLFMPLNILKTY